jgi:hypothetical protein
MGHRSPILVKQRGIAQLYLCYGKAFKAIQGLERMVIVYSSLRHISIGLQFCFRGVERKAVPLGFSVAAAVLYAARYCGALSNDRVSWKYAVVRTLDVQVADRESFV